MMATQKRNASTVPQLAIVGAFDRHNYGDLLFPLIVEHAAKHFGFEGECTSYGVIASDLTRYGAVPTRTLRSLFDRKRAAPALVVLAGGEVLPATFPDHRLPHSAAARPCGQPLGEVPRSALVGKASVQAHRHPL